MTPSPPAAAKTDATTEAYFSMRPDAELDGLEVVPGVPPLAEVEGDTIVVVPAALKTLT